MFKLGKRTTACPVSAECVVKYILVEKFSENGLDPNFGERRENDVAKCTLPFALLVL